MGQRVAFRLEYDSDKVQFCDVTKQSNESLAHRSVRSCQPDCSNENCDAQEIARRLLESKDA